MPRAIYTLHKLEPGLAFVSSDYYGKQVWTLGPLRKVASCAICGRTLTVGTPAYRPMSNLANRMERVCTTCWSDSLERLGRRPEDHA